MLNRDCPAWLNIETCFESKLQVHNRLHQLLGQHDTPTGQQPALLQFIGMEEKSRALKQLFPANRHRAQDARESTVTLHVDNTSISNQPILFSESNINQIAIRSEIEESKLNSYYLSWGQDMGKEHLFNLLEARLLCMFTDVVCLFADDFQDFSHVLELLLSWAKIGVVSGHTSLKPNVLIVRHMSKSDLTRDALERLKCNSLSDNFGPIEVFHLAGEELSLGSRFRSLKETIWRKMDEIRERRRELRMLFASEHFENFFCLATVQFCRYPFEDFSFLRASRTISPVRDGITRLLRATLGSSIIQIMSFVAAAILVDGYPLEAHRFLPQQIFDSFYKSTISQALVEAYGKNPLVYDRISQDQIACAIGGSSMDPESSVCGVQDLLTFTLNRLCGLFDLMVRTNRPAVDFFLFCVGQSGISWTLILNPDFCICLRQPPNNVLSCGHSLCDDCVRRIGVVWIDQENAVDEQYYIDKCPLCIKGNLLVGLRPVTAGIRLLTLDGGGIRGKISVLILKAMQEQLHGLWWIQDLVDVAFGTSVGGLIALLLFLRETTIFEGLEIFDDLAKRLFPPCTHEHSFIQSCWETIRSLYQDCKYNPAVLEAFLKDRLDENKNLFSYQNARTSTKVAVVASEIGYAAPVVLANYNTQCSSAYKCFEPRHGKGVKIWQAGRATSAAPVLFPPMTIPGIGSLQDGGMSRHNNPLHLARSECLRMAPAFSDVDIAISIGTGRVRERSSPSTGSYRTVLLDGGLQRLWRAYNKNSFDGDITFQEVVTLISKEKRHAYIRLNVEIPPSISLTDVSKLTMLERCVDGAGNSLKREADDAVYALIAKSFYFQLDAFPTPHEKGYLCLGTIRHRIPGLVLVKLLQRLHLGKKKFREASHSSPLALFDNETDLCSHCHRYSKSVIFHVADLDRVINILFICPGREAREISAFPQSVKWFIDQQKIKRPFNNSAIGETGKLNHKKEKTNGRKSMTSCKDCQSRSNATNHLAADHRVGFDRQEREQILTAGINTTVSDHPRKEQAHNGNGKRSATRQRQSKTEQDLKRVKVSR